MGRLQAPHGVASGLQSTAMQVGGTIGTAVLGAVMAAKVNSALPAKWAAAHLPALSPTRLDGVKSLATVGVAPVQEGVPAQLEALMANVTHSAFISGMTPTRPPTKARGPRTGQDRTHGH
jgi:hypothetical protein